MIFKNKLELSSKHRGLVLALICVVLWALLAPTAKLATKNLDNHQFLFFSSLVSFLALLTSCVFYKKIHYLKKYTFKELLYISFLGLLGTYIYYLFLYLGYEKAKGIEVLAIQYTWPILIVVFSFFILKEKINLKKILSIILGFLGVLIVISKGDLLSINITNIEVITFVFLGASSFALFSVLSKRLTYESISLTTLYFLVSTVASFISMLYYSEFIFPSLNEYFSILLNGVFINGFSYLLWIKALKLSDASYLAPFIFITPVLSAIYLIVLFDEPIYFSYFIGMVCVIIAGLINSK